VKLKMTTLAEEERGMNPAVPWEGGGERSATAAESYEQR